MVLPLHVCVANGMVLCAQVVCLGAGVIARTSQATNSSSLDHWPDSAIDVASDCIHKSTEKQEPVTWNSADYPLQVLWHEPGGFAAQHRAAVCGVAYRIIPTSKDCCTTVPCCLLNRGDWHAMNLEIHSTQRPA